MHPQSVLYLLPTSKIVTTNIVLNSDKEFLLPFIVIIVNHLHIICVITASLCTVGCSPEVYRINLEQGRFLSPLTTGGREVKCCEFNDLHQLLACGTSEVRGHAEPLLTVYRARIHKTS